MRPLTDDETKVLFEKLANYIGKNIEHLINRPDEKCCFRLHKDRVYYVRCVSRPETAVVAISSWWPPMVKVYHSVYLPAIPRLV